MTPESKVAYLRAMSAQAGAVRGRVVAAAGLVEDREFSDAIHEVANAAAELGGLVELHRRWKGRTETDPPVHCLRCLAGTHHVGSTHR